MPNEQAQSTVKPSPKLSLDTWAVLLALFAAALIRLGAIQHIPW